MEDTFLVGENGKKAVVRLAMYSELYCGGEKAENLALLEKGIQAAVKADMYVLDVHLPLLTRHPRPGADGGTDR